VRMKGAWSGGERLVWEVVLCEQGVYRCGVPWQPAAARPFTDCSLTRYTNLPTPAATHPTTTPPHHNTTHHTTTHLQLRADALEEGVEQLTLLAGEPCI